ncbi:MAG: hypothetical protein ABSB42_11175 [Tepidisphaeraceae bacterium]|jgi:hypothetical protein
MAILAVVDTLVLQKANASLENQPRETSKFSKRLQLLKSIQAGRIRVLVSSKLIGEYRRQVREPRNVFIQNFFALLTQGNLALSNWVPWSGSVSEKAGRCRFPREDPHVLQTAIHNTERTWILTEEMRMLKTDQCIYRQFSVHIDDPTR